MTVNIALIGCGYWGGRAWYPTIRKSKYGLKYLVERGTPKIDKVADDVIWIKNIKELPDDVTHAVVATQAESHLEITEFLHKKRNIPLKNILVEKPCGTNRAEAIELMGVTPGFVFLYDPKYQYIKSALDIVGEPFLFRSVRASMGPKIRTDVCIIEDYMYHDLYLYLDLFGNNILNILADGCHRFLGYPISEASVTIQSRVLTANMFSSWWYPTKERRIVIVGTAGSFIYEENKLTHYASYYGKWPDYHLHQGTEAEITVKTDKSNLELQLEAFVEDKLPFARALMPATWKLIEKIKEKLEE